MGFGLQLRPGVELLTEAVKKGEAYKLVLRFAKSQESSGYSECLSIPMERGIPFGAFRKVRMPGNVPRKKIGDEQISEFISNHSELWVEVTKQGDEVICFFKFRFGSSTIRSLPETFSDADSCRDFFTIKKAYRV